MSASLLRVWPPLPPGLYLRRPRRSLPYPLDSSTCVLSSRARTALLHGVRTLGLVESVVLVPAYNHGSEVESLVRAGVECRFYDVTEDLAPDPDELDRLLDSSVRALYLIHYLGVPQDAARWRRWCDDRGLLLLEDAAQTWLAKDQHGIPVGSYGDLAVFCLYKTYGVPDGAALVLRDARAPLSGLDQPLGLLPALRAHTLWLAGRSKAVAAAIARRPRSRYDAVRDFALGDLAAGPTQLSLYALSRLADDATAARRRANHAMLAELLGAETSLFPRPPAYASPFAFALLTSDKDACLARLADSSVEGVDLWSVPHPSIDDRFQRASQLRRSIVLLPVHQELRPRDIERIAAAAAPPRRLASRLRVEEHATFGDVRDEWEALVAESDNVFATWEFCATWWRHHGDGRTARLLTMHERGGALRAIVPVFLWRLRPLRVARFVGHDVGDDLAPIAAPADRPAVARALRSHGRRWWDVLVADHVTVSSGWSGLLGGRVLKSEGNPALRFDGDWETYLRTRTRSLRSSIRSSERKLAERGDVRFRLTRSAATLDEDLDTLLKLHRARWGSGETTFGRTEAFQREFARRALDRGWLRLWTLEVDGVARASWLGFRLGHVEAHYQGGRDPAWDAERVGFVLLAHTIRAALDDGMREYRFLRGDEPYKYRFASHDDRLETFAVAQRGGAGVAISAATAAREARRAGRSLGTWMRAAMREDAERPR